MTQTLLRCYDCNRLLPLGAHNRAPDWRTGPGGCGYLEIPRDDEERFRRIHAGHRLGECRVVEGTTVGEGSAADPMRVTYFEAMDGRETVVVRRVRTRLDRPVIYEVLPGRLVIRPVALEVQSRDLRRQLEFELGEKLAADTIRRFVGAVEEVAERLDPDDLDEVGSDARDARLAYVRLGENHLAEILDRLRNDAPAESLRWLHRFMAENLEANDVMNLVLRKTFFVEKGGSPLY